MKAANQKAPQKFIDSSDEESDNDDYKLSSTGDAWERYAPSDEDMAAMQDYVKGCNKIIVLAKAEIDIDQPFRLLP